MTSCFSPVDYSSRDYLSIRQDMLNYATTLIPEWTSRSSNDFGVVLVELFAYMCDLLSYYNDRVANESYISTATQRQSILNIATLLDYIPAGNTAATTLLQFTNASGSNITVNRYTTIQTGQTGTTIVLFETDQDCTILAGTSNTVTATQGQIVLSEILAVSSGAQSQTYSLGNAPVVDGSVNVYVDTGSGPVQWTEVEHLIDVEAADRSFALSTNASQVVSVEFGDGTNGLVPPFGATITSTYRAGGGSVGNVGPNTLTYIATAVPAGLTVTNPAAASGGGDAESNDLIRLNAPRSLFTLNRAVSVSDWEQLALRVAGVGKANAITPGVYTSITVYIAPLGGGAPTSTLLNTVQTYLEQYGPATASVTTAGPSYTSVNMSVAIQIDNRYVQSAVSSNVMKAMQTLLGFDNVLFGDRIAQGDLLAAVNSVPGVLYSFITTLSLSTGIGDITFAANQIPTAGTLTITPSGGIITQ